MKVVSTDIIIDDSGNKRLRNTDPLDIDRDRRGQAYDPLDAVLDKKIFWNYYITYISLLIHFMIMAMSLNFWCRWSKCMMFYSFQILLLHAYCWAVPDRRFAYWVKDKKAFFMFLAILNMAGYCISIFIGSYLYAESRKGLVDGVVGYFGVGLIGFTMSQTPMMVMLSITMVTLSHRFDYE